MRNVLLAICFTSFSALAADVAIDDDSECLTHDVLIERVEDALGIEQWQEKFQSLVIHRISQSSARYRYRMLIETDGFERTRTFAVNAAECGDAEMLVAIFLDEELNTARSAPALSVHGRRSSRDHGHQETIRILPDRFGVYAGVGGAIDEPSTGGSMFLAGLAALSSRAEMGADIFLAARWSTPYELGDGLGRVKTWSALGEVMPRYRWRKLRLGLPIGLGWGGWQSANLEGAGQGSSLASTIGVRLMHELTRSIMLSAGYGQELMRPRFVNSEGLRYFSAHGQYVSGSLMWIF